MNRYQNKQIFLGPYAATSCSKNVLTMEMVKEMVMAMQAPLPTVALNPYVRLPVDNDMTLADEKEAGTLPRNIMLSKSVPLLTGYQFDKSLLDFPVAGFSKERPK